MKYLNPFFFLLICAATSAGFAASPAQDRAIEHSARSSYALKSILDGQVNVSVKAGVATLTGTAHDRNLRSLAAHTLLGIPSVTGVNNQIIVETHIPEYSDAWIALKLRNRLLVHSGIDSARMEIEVINQIARLHGYVDDQEQKQLAEDYAKKVAWVRSVKNELQVVISEAAPRGAIDDPSVSALIIYALNDERLIQVSNVQISTLKGVVTVSGFAESEEAKSLVTIHALRIRGVSSVKNNMVIRNTDPARDPRAAWTS